MLGRLARIATDMQMKRCSRLGEVLACMGVSLGSLFGTACQVGGAEDQLEEEPAPVLRELPTPPCASGSVGDAFVGRKGSELLLDGEPFRPLGANVYYLQQLFAYAEQGQEQAAEPALQALDQATCLGLRVVRTSGFNDSQDTASIRTAPGVYHEAGLKGLDRAVAEAKLRGLRVILPLVNYWDDYGGLPAYARWAGDADGDPDRFFSPGPMQVYWMEYTAMLADRLNTYTGVRYRDEPAILAWEVGNELRCPSCIGGTRMVDTMRDLAGYLKRLFPNQLIGDGGQGLDDLPAAYEGFSNTYWVRGDEGVSFSKLLAVEDLDLVSYHMHFGPRGFEQARDADIWIDTHERLAKQSDRVPYLGEFGLEPLSSDPDGERAAAFNHWLYRLYEHNQGRMGILWQLIPAARQASGDDGYGVLYEQTATASVLSQWAMPTGDPTRMPGRRVGSAPVALSSRPR
jgi:mannan endo-1,4-beta-mannosidase